MSWPKEEWKSITNCRSGQDIIPHFECLPSKKLSRGEGDLIGEGLFQNSYLRDKELQAREY